MKKNESNYRLVNANEVDLIPGTKTEAPDVLEIEVSVKSKKHKTGKGHSTAQKRKKRKDYKLVGYITQGGKVVGYIYEDENGGLHIITPGGGLIH